MHLVTTLSQKYKNHLVLLIVDEIDPKSYGFKQDSDDWSDLQIQKNVVWLLAIQPRSGNQQSVVEIQPPQHECVLSERLLFKHRNCAGIR